jgi:hypothetical protein
MNKILGKVLLISCVCATVVQGNPFVSANNLPEQTLQNVKQENSLRVLAPKVKNDNAKVFDYQQSKEKNKLKHTFKVSASATDTVIDIPFESSNGEYLKLHKNKEGKTGTVGNIYNKEGKSIGIFSVTLDGEQNPENVTASTDANTLRLNVKGTNRTEPYQMVLSTETTYYSTYFNSFEWITRDSDYPLSLSLNHTNYFYEGPTQWDIGIRAADAWDKVVAVHSGSPNWSNASGLEDQLLCHVHYASNKNPWNIEPSRPDYSWTGTVVDFCNPGSGIWD